MKIGKATYRSMHGVKAWELEFEYELCVKMYTL